MDSSAHLALPLLGEVVCQHAVLIHFEHREVEAVLVHALVSRYAWKVLDVHVDLQACIASALQARATGGVGGVTWRRCFTRKADPVYGSMSRVVSSSSRIGSRSPSTSSLTSCVRV